jgi:hypothetical protein
MKVEFAQSPLELCPLIPTNKAQRETKEQYFDTAVALISIRWVMGDG